MLRVMKYITEALIREKVKPNTRRYSIRIIIN